MVSENNFNQGYHFESSDLEKEVKYFKFEDAGQRKVEMLKIKEM